MKSLMIRDINTIYIPIFENETFRRDLEFGLTKELKDAVLSRTGLRIVNKDNADTILSGIIKEIQEMFLTQNTDDNIVEDQITLIVDFKLVERSTGRILVQRQSVAQRAEFIIGRGETILSAYEEVLADMAETIVNLIEEKW